jgi:hypothetical protein
MRRGKSRVSGLLDGSLFLGFILGAARRSCRTMLLHKVRCSNSRLGAYAESTSVVYDIRRRRRRDDPRSHDISTAARLARTNADAHGVQGGRGGGNDGGAGI